MEGMKRPRDGSHWFARAAAISALLALGLACSKGEHQGHAPDTPEPGKGALMQTMFACLES